MYRLPAGFVGEYAEADARLTLDLWNHFKNLLSQQDLWQIFNLETEVLPVCIDMTRKGILVDLESAENLKQTLLKTVKKIKGGIKKETGVDIELWSAASVAKVFDHHKISYSRTATGMPSFTKNFLKTHSHPMAQQVAEARELDKLGNTFLSSIFRYTKKGRIHGHINQLRSEGGGTVSGRVSMSNPNLQQIPARNPKFSGMIRGLFLPEEGEQWASMDYTQQEPRILVHFSSLTNHGLEGSEEFVAAYRKDPKTDFHKMVSEIAKIERSEAKTLNLALMYGMGVNRLAETLDLSVEDAKALMSQYHDKVPFVKELQEVVQRRVKDAKSQGAIRSLLGRKCRFDLWEPNLFVSSRALPREEALHEYGDNIRRAYTYKALNRLIQASAADQTKAAMVAIKRETKRTPLVQIHDELAYSVSSKDDAKNLCRIMENAVEMEVPTPADIKLGKNWGSLHTIP
jgi:DNA polymerase I-like protein with 3'-5' exonuclease and polymerase domains